MGPHCSITLEDWENWETASHVEQMLYLPTPRCLTEHISIWNEFGSGWSAIRVKVVMSPKPCPMKMENEHELPTVTVDFRWLQKAYIVFKNMLWNRDLMRIVLEYLDTIPRN
jgi:hypothetical protein